MPQTILIAAHDPWFLQLLRVYTAESGFQAVEVYEGRDVLPKIQEILPAAVLLQIDLPGEMLGWDVLHAIKANAATCRIPVLVFTYHDHPSAPGIPEGADGQLQEPVSYETFVDALRRAGLNPLHSQPMQLLPRESPKSTLPGSG